VHQRDERSDDPLYALVIFILGRLNMLKKTYICNICQDKIEIEMQSFGLCFSGLKTFTLGGYGCTEGTHICYGCAVQLYNHLNNGEIKKLLGI